MPKELYFYEPTREHKKGIKTGVTKTDPNGLYNEMGYKRHRKFNECRRKRTFRDGGNERHTRRYDISC